MVMNDCATVYNDQLEIKTNVQHGPPSSPKPFQLAKLRPGARGRGDAPEINGVSSSPFDDGGMRITLKQVNSPHSR